MAAQKLLFGHSVHGDMLPRLTGGHYDTKIGAKQAAASYAAIVADLSVPAAQVLFLTDIVGGKLRPDIVQQVDQILLNALFRRAQRPRQRGRPACVRCSLSGRATLR